MTEAQPQRGPALNDPKYLTRLRQTQRLAFERYLDIASKICGRISTMTPESMSDLDRANLAAGKRMEAAAYAAYLKARAELLDYLGGNLAALAAHMGGEQSART